MALIISFIQFDVDVNLIITVQFSCNSSLFNHFHLHLSLFLPIIFYAFFQKNILPCNLLKMLNIFRNVLIIIQLAIYFKNIYASFEIVDLCSHSLCLYSSHKPEVLAVMVITFYLCFSFPKVIDCFLKSRRQEYIMCACVCVCAYIFFPMSHSL